MTLVTSTPIKYEAPINPANALIQRHQHDLLQFVASLLGNRSEAEDVLQQCYLRLDRALHKGPIHKPRSYLFQIAANLARDRLRQRRTEPYSEVLDYLLPSDHNDPSRWLANQQEVARLQRAIERLPPKCRRVFMLKKWDGLSYAEIAHREGIRTKTVENHIIRALASIRAFLYQSEE